MFQITPTGSQTLQEAVQRYKDMGFYVAETTIPKTNAKGEYIDVNGNVVDSADKAAQVKASFALTLDEYMLSTGIRSVEAQDKVLAALMSQMEFQTRTMTDINDALQALNTALASAKDGKVVLSADLQALLTKLSSDPLKVLQLGDIAISGTVTQAQAETLQKNLSTAQSSQGALNEDISLKLNEAASKRSAIFTQLQTLLQTLMQTRQSLARW